MRSVGKRAIKKEAAFVKLLRELLARSQELLATFQTKSKQLWQRYKRAKPVKPQLLRFETESSKLPKRSKKYRFPVRKLSGPRMAERQKHRSQWIKIIALAGSCSVLLFTIIVLLQTFNLTPFFQRESAIVKKTAKQPKMKTLLFIGTEKKDEKEAAARLSLFIFQEGDETVAGWSIPESTFVVVPGHGFEKIGLSLESGVKTTVSVVKNFLGIEIDHYAKLSYEDYEETVSKLLLHRALEKAEQTNLDNGELASYSAWFDTLNEQNIELIPLPVNPIMVGRETFYEPDKDEIDRLFELLWGISKDQREATPRVIVLNGSGVPGVGADAAERLININCRVVQNDNANNFDYDRTQIIIYKGANEWANRIKKTLGVGVIVRQDVPQDLADATIVIGKDYQLER